MPSNYAHFLFGTQLLPTLPHALQQTIASCPELYQIGQHGPDIIFYYRTFLPHSASRIGFQMHRQPANTFFEQARTTIQTTEDPSLIAYTLGFICHFILDSTCHKYIYEQLSQINVSHTELETEFDRMLILKQQKNPLITNATEHIVASKEHANQIAKIFVPLTPEQIYEGMRSMKFVHRLLLCPNTSKRCTIHRILRLLHAEPYLGGLVMNPLPNPLCRESNAQLYQLYQKALIEAVPILTEYYYALFTNAPLSDRFAYNYRGELCR